MKGHRSQHEIGPNGHRIFEKKNNDINDIIE